MEKDNETKDYNEENLTSRRDFIVLTASAMTAVGAAACLWPLVNSLNPAADVLALGSIEVDLSVIAEGQTKVETWQGKPVFIRHRTDQEIAESKSVKLSELRDPES